jgi:homocysteine S-methyltransferase
MRDVEALLAGEFFVLVEGAVIERLRRDPAISLDPHIVHAGMVYDPRARATLADVYRRYLDVGRRYDLPMVTLTPTWRASAARLKRAGLAPSQDVNGECVRFLFGLAAETGAYAHRVAIGGMLGPAGDAYRPQEALSLREAEAYHAFQVRALSKAGVDFLIAATLPAYSEALGMARAMARSGTPYVLSFVLRPTGVLLDGTPLHEAVHRIDSTVCPRPSCYMANCVHPTVFELALERELERAPWLSERVIGLQGNTSCRSPEELDDLAELETEEPRAFARAMVRLYDRFGIKVLGGCCGTDERHIEWIARALGERNSRVSAAL